MPTTIVTSRALDSLRLIAAERARCKKALPSIAATPGAAARRSLKLQRSILFFAIALLGVAGAQNGSPAPRSEEQPSFMKWLADRGQHDLENERWNAYGQFTYISNWKLSFPALYTNL